MEDLDLQHLENHYIFSDLEEEEEDDEVAAADVGGHFKVVRNQGVKSQEKGKLRV